ncbi:hypothetical protein I350_00668 [Cryptococcus amylolentus CBS 6273]|uniref:PARP-type domain-containing protein n=1 Tax=Cryptococcus amylolentus CBS 6273 TaxID=1296118 RepID=A0A1E3KFK6_9TREE|nr:hypothetical protein I350_00668 [Cryptococcus amylolentus CBS 6273]
MPAYRLELASSSRALCNGKKPCFKTKIDKGQLRLGVWVEIPGRGGSFKWRHWGCVTPEVIKHWKEDFSEAEELDGYEDLSKRQVFVKDAWAEGHVRPEDVPESAKVEKVEEGAEDAEAELTAKKPAAKKGGKKAKKDEDEEGEDAGEAAPKKRKAPVKKSKKEEPSDEDVEDDAEEEEVPKKKRKAPAKKSAKAAKEEAEKEDDAEATEEVVEKSKSKGRGRPKKDAA